MIELDSAVDARQPRAGAVTGRTRGLAFIADNRGRDRCDWSEFRIVWRPAQEYSSRCHIAL